MKTETLILQPEQISFSDAVNIFRLRTEVFCTEQRCWYVDPDEYDLIATHILIYVIHSPEQKQLVGYARVYKKIDKYIIGRVCTHLLYRNNGFGRKLIELALQQCPKGSTIYLQAQAYLKNFYESFGFIQQSTTLIWEDAVAHIAMQKIQD
jgi:ElaA protein